ncbi:solute carrier family 28 member 3-like isoform X2 [Branchiostoma floridae x Branchiostoma belcheri]
MPGDSVSIELPETSQTEVAGNQPTAAQCYRFTKTDPDSVRVDVDPTAPPQETPPPAYNDAVDTEDGPASRRKCCAGPSMSTRILRACKEHKKPILITIGVLLLIGLIVFLAYAFPYFLSKGHLPGGCRNLIGLLGILGGVVFIGLYICISRFCGDDIYEHCLKHVFTVTGNIWVKRVFYVLCLIGLILWIALDTARNTQNLISGAGLIIMVIFLYIFSKHPDHVKWRPVLWGLALQFIFGLLILRTQVGFDVFKFMGEKFQSFIEYADVGSKFVFGEKYTDHFFAFKVLPIIVFFSSVMSVLYYIGLMQVVIVKMAWLLQRTMETSSPESINAAGNIFVGQTDAPLLIRPLIKDMTKSELHAVMTGGFATIAGSVLGAYIAFGVPPTHLLTASVMSAPAALAVSKLFYPETEETMRLDDNVQLGKGDERNVIEAVAQGAQIAITLVANIAVNLISFLALLAFFNGILSWVGCMVGYDILSFEIICSYVFMPLAFIMGVEWKDCRLVAELIGIKTFLNEFVAYEALAKIIKNRVTGVVGATTMSVRSEVIATYALCGFSNLGSMGIMLGGLGAMAPNRVGDLAEMVVRALIAGSIACFMTASLAGMLYQEPAAMIVAATNATFNATLNATANPNATVLPTVLSFLTSPTP